MCDADLCHVVGDDGHDAANPCSDSLLGTTLVCDRLPNPKVTFLIQLEVTRAERWLVAGQVR